MEETNRLWYFTAENTESSLDGASLLVVHRPVIMQFKQQATTHRFERPVIGSRWAAVLSRSVKRLATISLCVVADG